jgi:hypothetical protein
MLDKNRSEAELDEVKALRARHAMTEKQEFTKCK